MKKSDIDKILETQRKNLRFVDQDSNLPRPNKNSEFVTVDSKPAILEPASSDVKVSRDDGEAFKKAVKNSGTVGTYIDIRKLKLEKKRLALADKQENAEKEVELDEDEEPVNDDKFGIDFILNKQQSAIEDARAKSNGNAKKFDPIKSQAVGYKFLPNEVPVPAPALVGNKKKSAQRKVDDDLVDKKIFNTYFDDLLD